MILEILTAGKVGLHLLTETSDEKDVEEERILMFLSSVGGGGRTCGGCGLTVYLLSNSHYSEITINHML